MGMLTLSLDPNSKETLHQQLYSYIKLEIRSGRMRNHQKLPSKRKLSDFLKISQNTVQTAYDQLIEEGYIISLERKGFFVVEIDSIIEMPCCIYVA